MKPSPRLRKILRRLSAFLFVFSLVSGAAVAWLLGTEPGARFALSKIGVLMKGGVVKTGSLEGKLVSPFTIKGLVYETDSLRVTVETLTVKWNLAKLLKRQLDIASLAADGVVFVSKPTEEKSEGLTDVHLPINIVVHDARVTRLTLGEDPEAALLVDSIALSTATVDDSLRIDKLSIRAPLFDGDFEGTVTPLGDYPLSLDMKWAYRPAGSPAYSGHGSFRGNLAKLTVKETLEQPFAAEIDAVLTEPFRKLVLDVTARFQGVETKALDASWPAVTLGGEIRVTGPPDALHFEGEVATISEMLAKANVAFRVDRKENELAISKLELTRPGEKTAATVSGRVTLAEAPKPMTETLLDLEASWRELPLPLTGKPVLFSREGRAHVKGTLARYAIEAAADVAGAEIPPARLTLTGTGTENDLRLEALGAATLGGRIEGSGQVAWNPEVRWDLVLRGRSLDPSVRWKGYDGTLAFDLTTKGRLTPQGPEAHIALSKGEGTFRKQPFTANGTIDLAGETIRVGDLEIRAGESRLRASGVVGAPKSASDLKFDLSLPNLAALSPEASGALEARGRVTGTRDAPRIALTFKGSALGFGTRKATLLSGAADVDLAPNGALDVSVLASGVAWDPGFRPAEEVKLTAKGRSGSHTLTFEAESPDGSTSTVLAGGLDAARTAWTGEMRKLDVSTKTAGDWTLEGVAALHASAKRSTLEGFCFASQGGRLCASGSYGEGAFDVDARAERLPLTLLGPFLPENVTITGLLEGKAKARGGADGSLSADVDLRPGPGEIRFPGRGKAQESVTYRDAALTLKADARGLHAVAGTLLAESGRVSLDLTSPRFAERSLKTKEQPVTGRVLLDVPRLDVIQGFVSEFREVKGSLKADLALGGTLGSPTVRGEAVLVGGGATVPDLGITLKEIGLVARGDGSGPLRFEGSLVSGQGKLRIEGETPVTPGALTATVVKVSGENVELLNQPPENRIVASPRLTITLLGSRVDVTGEVEIPRAKYERKSAFATVRVSPDVVIVSREPAAGATAAPEAIRELYARVRIILGDDVRLKASGLETKISGSILAIGQPGKRTVATGELELRDGTYKAYGQDLRIERGRLTFGGGPIDNPGVDARASRKARDGTVAGLVIKGSLRNPETTVFSDPAMGQADALAYILLGHPLNEATQEEGSLVTNAVGSLGIKGGNLLMKQLAAKFGLEEARIETEGTYREASLIVGKYLSPRIYVEYGIGLFTRASTLRVSYILNKHWTVRAETGAANAGDVFYTIEK